MNDRLKEISDYVDEYIIKNELVNCISNDRVHNNVQNTEKQQEYDNFKIINDMFMFPKEHVLYFIFNKSKYYYYDIKFNNKSIDNIQLKTLTYLFVSLLFIINRNTLLIYEYGKQLLEMAPYIDKYQSIFCDTEEKKLIYNFINDNETSFEKIKNIGNKKKEKINIEYIETYKKHQIGFIEKIEKICNVNLEKMDDNNQYDKINKKIFMTYLDKITEYYRFIKKCNKPELEIYNFLVDKISNNVLYVFTNIKIPVSRPIYNKKLIVDIMVLINIDGNLHILAIEYDGPTHSNIKDFRFSEKCVECDKTKNKFCIENGISLIRLDYRINMKQHKQTIDYTINNILLYNKPVYHGIPSEESYDKLIRDFYHRMNHQRQADSIVS